MMPKIKTCQNFRIKLLNAFHYNKKVFELHLDAKLTCETWDFPFD